MQNLLRTTVPHRIRNLLLRLVDLVTVLAIFASVVVPLTRAAGAPQGRLVEILQLAEQPACDALLIDRRSGSLHLESFSPPLVLETERFRLRPLNENNLSDIKKILMNPKVAEMSGDYLDEHTVARLIRRGDQSGESPYPGMFINFGIWEKGDTGRLIGMSQLGVTKTSGLNSDPRFEVFISKGTALRGQMWFELSYHLDPSVWGKGVATEVARQLTRYAFVTFEADGVHAHTIGTNDGSGNVLKKLGLSLILSRSFPSIKGPQTTNYYAMTKAEYERNQSSDTSKTVFPILQPTKPGVLAAPARASRHLTAEVSGALDGVSNASPVVITLRVMGVDGADALDAALNKLKKYGATVEGSGFPLEAIPPRGERTVTITTQEQASTLKRILVEHEGPIFGASIKTVDAVHLNLVKVPNEAVALEKLSADKVMSVVASMAEATHESWQKLTRASGKTERFKPVKVDGQQVVVRSTEELKAYIDGRKFPPGLYHDQYENFIQFADPDANRLLFEYRNLRKEFLSSADEVREAFGTHQTEKYKKAASENASHAYALLNQQRAKLNAFLRKNPDKGKLEEDILNIPNRYLEANNRVQATIQPVPR